MFCEIFIYYVKKIVKVTYNVRSYKGKGEGKGGSGTDFFCFLFGRGGGVLTRDGN